jgi:hypothetical protein
MLCVTYEWSSFSKMDQIKISCYSSSTFVEHNTKYFCEYHNYCFIGKLNLYLKSDLYMEIDIVSTK